MLLTKDILVVIPTLGRVNMLTNAVNSFIETSTDSSLCVVHDNEDIVGFQNPRITSLKTPERLGYWGVLNYAIGLFPYPLIGFFANDVLFHLGWEKNAVSEFNKNFPDLNGLLAIRDDVWNDYHAAHGFTTLSWLKILYGKPEFPPYGHHYGDSELTQFTKDLGRFRYTDKVYIEHLHPDKNKRERDDVDNMADDLMSRTEAKKKYDRRYMEWKYSAQNEAMRRLK